MWIVNVIGRVARRAVTGHCINAPAWSYVLVAQKKTSSGVKQQYNIILFPFRNNIPIHNNNI